MEKTTEAELRYESCDNCGRMMFLGADDDVWLADGINICKDCHMAVIEVLRYGNMTERVLAIHVGFRARLRPFGPTGHILLMGNMFYIAADGRLYYIKADEDTTVVVGKTIEIIEGEE